MKKHSFKGKNNPAYAHGMSGTKQNVVWNGIKSRCNNKNLPDYHRWGGRGITYDPKWETFDGFWDDMKHKWAYAKKKYPGEVLSIDRIDNDGNYCKENCRIIPKRMNVSRTQPLNNKRSKPVWQLDKVTRKRIKLFPSAMEVERAGIALHSNIAKACLGKTPSIGGYKWEFA